MKKIISCVLVICLAATVLSGCPLMKKTLNGVDISEYTIVYSEDSPDYCLRAAQYIKDQVLARTGVELAISEAGAGSYDYEIVVGETDRAISAQLDAQTENVEFAILADENHIALEGDYFVIAAAAYFFVETYVPGRSFQSQVPSQITVHQPITREADNFIFLIGDGMGVNHTKLFEVEPIPEDVYFYDNEDIFYGYYLPYQGMIQTWSLSGVTDSAASATALATGYKTINHYVGRDENLQDLQSLTELAGSLGMGTAVMSTEDNYGATPAGFSSHADDRDDRLAILDGQMALMQSYNTIIECGLHAMDGQDYGYQDYIVNTLAQLQENEKGFFVMYEEAYIDKYSHNQDVVTTFEMVIRFNQAIGVFMEYAFYHPNTFVIITADHETGGLLIDGDGVAQMHTDNHTAADVPIFAYGCGAEVFDGCNMDNTGIPKVIAGLWGAEDFGDPALD